MLMSRSRAMRSELWPAATSRSTSVSRAESFGTAAVVPDSPTAAESAVSFDEVPWASPCAACSCGCTCPTGSSKKCSRSGDCSARPVTVSVVTLSCRCSPDAHGIETVCGSRDAPSSGSRGAGGFCDPPPPRGLGCSTTEHLSRCAPEDLFRPPVPEHHRAVSCGCTRTEARDGEQGEDVIPCHRNGRH